MLSYSHMNLCPSGKQAQMKDRWVMWSSQKIMQLMAFPMDHPKFPNQPKGMKWVLQEYGLWIDGHLMKCQDRCSTDSADYCAKHLLKVQPDF